MISHIISLIFIGVILSYFGSATAQLQEPWKTYTSEECNVSFQYPSNWLLKTKQGTFDTNTTFLFGVYESASNFMPTFSLQNCLDLDVINNILRMAPIVNNVSDAKSYSLFTEATLPLLSALLDFAAEDVSTSVPKITIVEHTRLKPKLVSGEDAAALTAQIKGEISSSSINLGARLYSVIHNGMGYPFMFTDDVSQFDNPENTKIREQILNSIRFTNSALN